MISLTGLNDFAGGFSKLSVPIHPKQHKHKFPTKTSLKTSLRPCTVPRWMREAVHESSARVPLG